MNQQTCYVNVTKNNQWKQKLFIRLKQHHHIRLRRHYLSSQFSSKYWEICAIIRLNRSINLTSVAMATRYWVASLPVGQGSSASSVWTRLQESISKQAFDTSLYRVLLMHSTFCCSLQISSAIRVFSQLDSPCVLDNSFFFCFFHLIIQFNIPNLRVGTLDSLLALSDDLLKVSCSEA